MSHPLKKILVLTSTFPRWRGDKEPPFVYELSQRLSEHYHVSLLAPHAKGAALKEQWGNLRIIRFKYCFEKYQTLAYEGGILSRLKQNRWRYLLVPLFIIAEWFALIRLLREEQFDLIHAHWIIPQGLIAVILSGFCKRPPILCTSHGSDLLALQGNVFTKLKQFVLIRITAMTVVSRTLQKKAMSLGIDQSKLSVIPMGVDIKKQFIPPLTPRHKNSLLFVGRLVEQKGLYYLLEALSVIKKELSDITLTIVGTGPNEKQLKQQVNDLELTKQVKFLGAIEYSQLPTLYQLSEIVVFPSINAEGFGLVLVEALSCECAVIASDLPAMQDILTDNKNALIFEQKNILQLAENILHLLNNPELRHSLGKQGREDVLERYDWEIIAEQYHQLIERIV